MTEEKVTEVPVDQTPETTDDESLIDNRRAELENIVIADNEVVPEKVDTDESVPDEVEETEVKPEEEKTEIESTDPVDRIKKAVQKRIDKVVAQKKSAEEELSEARAEIARLKQSKPEVPDSSPATPPTLEQVEAYIIQMREEGNTKEEIAATRYLIKLEKDTAIEEFRQEQVKAQTQTKEVNDKQLSEWTELCRDYASYTSEGKPDPTSELDLNNQKGLLYTTALSLYNDKELHADYYNNPNVIHGFRRAVADAYREIHQQGLVSNTPKENTVLREKRTPKLSLADPDAEVAEDSTQSSSANSLSDADRVREEIKARNKNRYFRKVPSK